MNELAVDVAFWGFGVASAWFGFRVFRTKSMVRASFALLASFLNAAAIMVLLLAEYLGVALFFMMAIEMTVMALFMVAFMMNPAGLNPMNMVHQQRMAIAAGVVSAAAIALVAIAGTFPAQNLQNASGRIEALGQELLGPSMLIFETAGVALLATMVSAVVLSARSSRYGVEADEGSRPPPIDPDDPESVPDVKPEQDGEDQGQHQHGGGS